VGLYAQQDLSNLSWEEVANRMPAEWYASDQAAEVAETVLNHQTKIGGWTKNTDFHKKINEEEWAKVSESGIGATFDNAATITEMRFLAKMYKNRKDERYKDAFIKGFNYILKAQYDNGGWPQFYPARPNNSVSYSACITFNDNAYVNVMNMLKDIFTDAEDLKTLKLDDNIKKLARESFDKGVRCILDTQIIVDGERTVWCAQHDQVTLKPAKARAYELPSFSGAESVNITLLLMSLPSPSDEVVAAIKGAVKWFDKHKIPDMKYERYKDENGEKDSKLVPSPGSVVWARFYDLETEKPFFCGRDGIKKETLQEIEKERRGGYSWYNNAPSKVLKEYPEWLNKIN
jgi:PelA/Pel-15E family pectate lyase